MTAQVIARDSLLHRALQLDAVASGVLGALLVATSGSAALLLDLPPDLLLGTGLAMLVWAAVTGWLGTRARVPHRGAVMAIVVNLVWAADSVILLLTGWVEPNPLGMAFIVVQAMAVLALTELQYVGLRRAQA